MGSCLNPCAHLLLVNNRWRLSYDNVFPSGYFSPNWSLKVYVSKQRGLRFSPNASSYANVKASWIVPDRDKADAYGGWFSDSMPKEKNQRGILYVGIGASVWILLAALAHSAFSSKGLKFQLYSQLRPLHAIQGFFMPSRHGADSMGASETDVSGVNQITYTDGPYDSEMVDNALDKMKASTSQASTQKLESLIIPLAVDSTQQESVSVLKKLKIIEDSVNPEALCTRREYVRWLLKANSLLERSAKCRLFLPTYVAGSPDPSFDDISPNDSDFCYIQALAESGIVLSKLTVNQSGGVDNDNSTCQQRIEFSPDSLISRLDLMNWKTMLEYSVYPEVDDKMLLKVDFMDVMAMEQDASIELFMDMLAGDGSIVRRVFGQSRRFQPRKPVTKAQAAVALTSGRAAEAIQVELIRLEAEKMEREANMKDIRSELLQKGEIQQFWEEKKNNLKIYWLGVERDYQEAVKDLQEREKRDETLDEWSKERVAIVCRKELLSEIKREVDEMTAKLASERERLSRERQILNEMLGEVQSRWGDVVEAKSVLEAEIEAIRILRSWVEDEAKRNEARAKLLVAAQSRWNWVESKVSNGSS
ncbi:uncharacterized protein LOC18432527 [Amborella trichopoda]|uniref:SLH domain-containing protein n=1 Tax=Amborella trichopoda TaxID=13333 RepID=W1P8W6_AMBTC|nr:uncharacterized protein LOC18432527 [Amborella trichopoda]ERN04368.1 hypothetical protein AMTR_s00147p00073200 [Amborella trichopoda]|eukprot:XP_006842693.1 uncharacterized protein LOC18432527 [Amborella trichopoda]